MRSLFPAALSLSALLAVSSATSASFQEDPALTSDVGNWTVGDCILAEFAMEFTVFANISDRNQSTTFRVPARAAVDDGQSNCGNLTQDLSLDWSGASANETSLARNVTIVFGRKNDTAYGVRQIYGKFHLADFEWFYPKQNKTLNVSSYLDVDSGDVSELMFRVPLSRSYLCADTNKVQLAAHFHYTIPDQPTQGTVMKNATVELTHVQFDAFRTDGTKPPRGFRIPMDCDYQPNDIVPIVVGVALAALVIMVLIAYLIGRRRTRQRGYESV